MNGGRCVVGPHGDVMDFKRTVTAHGVTGDLFLCGEHFVSLPLEIRSASEFSDLVNPPTPEVDHLGPEVPGL